MPDDIKTSALAYRLGFEWSVIPIKTGDKVPLIRWQDYQDYACEEDEILGWWDKFPDANLGIVTGKVSGITVVDVDDDSGIRELQKYLPPVMITPTAVTQKGGRHLYFKYVAGLSNKVRVIPGVDVRNDGGFVVAPPSIGSKGPYKWIDGLEPGRTDLAFMPPELVTALKGEARPAYEPAPSRDVSLKSGSRNDSVFHFAHLLVKGGARTKQELMTALLPVGRSCEPPLPDSEISTICDSALKREGPFDEKADYTLKVKDWVSQSVGEFDQKNVYSDLGVNNDPKGRSAIRMVLMRLVEAGILKRMAKDGFYRKVEDTRSEIDLTACEVGDLDFTLPLGLSDHIRLYPGNVLLFAGEQNVGKTAAMLEVVRMNQDRFPIDYYSSEMGATEFKVRLNLYGPEVKWKFKAYERNSNYADVIAPGRVSIVDFMEVTDEFYKVGKMLSEIHEKLNGTGLAVVAIQKGKYKEFGRGGDLGMEKPRLYVTMSRSEDLAGAYMKIVKAKNWKTERNPNGLVRPFNVVMGHRFMSSHDWMSVDEYDALFGTENLRPKASGKKVF